MLDVWRASAKAMRLGQDRWQSGGFSPGFFFGEIHGNALWGLFFLLIISYDNLMCFFFGWTCFLNTNLWGLGLYAIIWDYIVKPIRLRFSMDWFQGNLGQKPQ